MSKGLFISLLLSTTSFLEGVAIVNDGTALNSAIINANGVGDPNIQFGSSFTYNQLLQPFNTDGVLNSTPRTITLDGLGNTLTAGAGSQRCFFARDNAGNSVTIRNLTIVGAHARGGNGNSGGGGGLGAGGGLFLNTNSTVILDDVSFNNCKATGGSSSSGAFGGGGGLGGDSGIAFFDGGTGGGGFSGSGGPTFDNRNSGGGGGGGFNGNGGRGTPSNGAGGGGGGGGHDGDILGGAGDGGPGLSSGQGGPGSGVGTGGNLVGLGGGSGGVGNVNGNDGSAGSGGSGPGGGGGTLKNAGGSPGANGGDGGPGFGGGGSGFCDTNTNSGNGGKGGFGGGGGGSGAGRSNSTVGTGGAGDFGGGGGGAGGQGRFGAHGGPGGFGGGGGSGGGTRQVGAGGDGGFGGGDGHSIDASTGVGGGGAAMGADIFIQNGADLFIQTAISFEGSTLTAGTGGNPGSEHGINIFMMSEGHITVESLNRDSSVPNPIRGNIGIGGGNPIVGGGLTLGFGNTAVFSLEGENNYTGHTTIHSGTLNLNGSVITPVTLNGGVFSGNASLLRHVPVLGTGNLNVNGGTVSPGGTSYGTIFVGNNLTFSGGEFLTEVDSVGNVDLLDVNGTANLTGTLTVDQAIGNFLRGQTITILEADGGVTGTFGTVNFPQGANQPLFGVQYTGTTVELVVLADHVFVRPVIDPGNPRHVAKYILDQLPIDPNSDFGLVVRSLGVLTDKELNKTLNMMHQGVFGTYEWMNLTTNAQIMQMFNQRPFRLFAQENDEPLSHLTASTKPFYPNAPVRRGCERTPSKPHHVYFQPFGTWNSQGQKGELRGLNYENAGFLTGYDYLLRNYYVGGCLGYAYTNFRWDSSAGKGHINQVYGGIHGSYFNRYFSAILGTMLGGNFYGTNRNITSSAPEHPNASLNRTAHSDSSGIQWTNHLGLIGDFNSFSIPLQVFANLDHFYLHNGSFNETGADSINLRVNSKTSNALRSEIGLSSSYTFKMAGGCCTPYARISWVNKTLLSSSTYRGGFRGQVGTFSASATSKGTNQWAPGLGIEFATTPGFSLLLNSRAEINGKMKNYAADMRMEYAF